MNHIIDQLHEVQKRFSDEVFLSNKGLSNEVGIHVFCYDPGGNAGLQFLF